MSDSEAVMPVFLLLYHLGDQILWIFFPFPMFLDLCIDVPFVEVRTFHYSINYHLLQSIWKTEEFLFLKAINSCKGRRANHCQLRFQIWIKMHRFFTSSLSLLWSQKTLPPQKISSPKLLKPYLVIIFKFLADYFLLPIVKLLFCLELFLGVIESAVDGKVFLFSLLFFCCLSSHIEILWLLFNVQMLNVSFWSINIEKF